MNLTSQKFLLARAGENRRETYASTGVILPNAKRTASRPTAAFHVYSYPSQGSDAVARQVRSNSTEVTTMATVVTLKVSNATQVGPANWVTPRNVFGPQLILSPAPRGVCVVQALTAPANSPAEWNQIVWVGGEPLPGKPNQRLVSRQEAGKTTVGAAMQGRG